MGFKNSGFPDFRFNPLGFRTTGPLRYLIRNCGLESYSKGVTDGVLIDKVGKTGTESSREAVQALTLLGDGSTYLEADGILIPETDDFDVTFKCIFDNIVSREGIIRQYTSAPVDPFRWYVTTDVTGVLRYFHGGNVILGTTVVSTTEESVVRFVKDATSTRLYLNDNLEITDINRNMEQSNTIFLSDSSLGSFEGKLKSLTINNGITYTLDINPDNNEYALIPDDNSPQIDVQQFLAPATPTEINITNEDIRDLYGYTVATGVETRDSAGLSPYTVGYKIPNYYNGLSVGYLSGEHFRGTYTGRVKYNFSLVGDVLKLDDLYNGIFIADVTGILHTAGVLNELSWSGIPNIKLGEGGNPQMIANKDEESVAFYENGLPEGSDCLYRALKLQKLNEGYQVQTTESSGEYETYNVTEGPYFVIKEGVTIG